MLNISTLTKKNLEGIELLVFDVDGTLVKRGTKINQVGNVLTLETKKIAKKQIGQIKKLYEKGFFININSGRGLSMLQDMFREILPCVILTYENGSASYFKGRIYQHVNSFEALRRVSPKLRKIKHKDIKGFEPKEFLVSIHCKKRIKKIEGVILKEKNLYCIWHDKAYDIGIKGKQTKAQGLKCVAKVLGVKKKNILAIGDSFNDKELLNLVGTAISADKNRVKGDFYIERKQNILPADILMQKILKEV